MPPDEGVVQAQWRHLDEQRLPAAARGATAFAEDRGLHGDALRELEHALGEIVASSAAGREFRIHAAADERWLTVWMDYEDTAVRAESLSLRRLTRRGTVETGGGDGSSWVLIELSLDREPRGGP